MRSRSLPRKRIDCNEVSGEVGGLERRVRIGLVRLLGLHGFQGARIDRMVVL